MGLKRGETGKGSIDKGYRVLHIKGRGYVLEHRYVMEQALGRQLETAEHVHHINGNKLDNRLENLAVLSRRAHNLTERTEGKLSNYGRPVTYQAPRCAIEGCERPYKARGLCGYHYDRTYRHEYLINYKRQHRKRN